MAEQDWTAFADDTVLADTDILLVARGAGGVNIPGSALLRRDIDGNYYAPWAGGENPSFGMKFSTTYDLSVRFNEPDRSTRIVSRAADSTGFVGFYTGTAENERMRISAGGNVGIGTASPDSRLHVHSASNTQIIVSDDTLGDTYGGVIRGFGVGGDGGNLQLGVLDNGTFRKGIQISAAANTVTFHTTTGGTERMRIDSAGNVSIADAGSPAQAKLDICTTNTGTETLGIHIGYIATFYGFRVVNDSYPGAVAAGSFHIQRGDTTQWINALSIDNSGNILAGQDNAKTLGGASNRWSTVFAGTGTINTSDERGKKNIGAIPDKWLDAWAGVQWQRFKMKGGTRWHIGLVAQQVHSAFAAEGIDAFEIGLCCFDEWQDVDEPIFENVKKTRKVKRETGELTKAGNPKTETVDEEFEEAVDTGKTKRVKEAGDIWGLRYDECQAIEAAYQRRRLDRLEAALASLQN